MIFCLRLRARLLSVRSGAYLHAHNAAWNGLVSGRKRWLLLTPGKLQDSHELPAGQVPAFEWFRDSSPIWREKLAGHIIEFTQEEGEVVYVPDTWGHAILNLEPCIGVRLRACAAPIPPCRSMHMFAPVPARTVLVDCNACMHACAIGLDHGLGCACLGLWASRVQPASWRTPYV